MSTATATRSEVMSTRLQNLRAERVEVLGELQVSNGGDAADRATNVDANARLALIEQRIAALESQLHEAGRAVRDDSAGVALGDVVTVDFGDGPETYLVAEVEQAGDGLDVISPASPLGRAIVGAEVGTTVAYSPRHRLNLEAKIIAVS